MTIGEIARSGRREYDARVVAHLADVQFARATGFTLKETRQLVRGFSPGTTASTRWRALAGQKPRRWMRSSRAPSP